MLERLYLEDYLSFKQIDLNFRTGLIVFTGPSGAGKSILFQSIVSLFGQGNSDPKLAEINLRNNNLSFDGYILEDDLTIKQNKTNKTRYFLNNQSIAKSNLKEFTKTFFKHLHLKDTSDFDNINIIRFIDFLGSNKDHNYKNLLGDFQNDFNKLQELKTKLKKIIEDEKNIEEIKDFTRFEIEKIATIDPKLDEYEDLKELKTIFSKKEKFENALEDAKPFLDNSYKISNALETLGLDSGFFDDAINEVNNQFEKFYDQLDSMDDIDLDETMQRIDDLSKLIKKYGSIQEALEYKKIKEHELESYENISFEKSILEKNIKKLNDSCSKKATQLTKERKKLLMVLKDEMDKFLKDLYLENLDIQIIPKEIDIDGGDSFVFSLNNVILEKLSSGEFNRLRLALLTARSVYETQNGGILFLDEVDANLSGKESESIGKVLALLSKKYQIFAISHQPQLSSLADQHFLVEKQNGISHVKEIVDSEKINEISRMISGENITPEAIEFAKKLLK